MPYDTNGVATINRNRAVTGQVVDAAQVNTPFDDTQSMLSQVLLRSGVAPMTGDLNMNGFRVSGAANAVSDNDFVTLSQLKEMISDSWAFVPIGSLVAANNGWGAFVAPPIDRNYRYIVLTAGMTAPGQYNNGVISNENTTGMSPNIQSTATVSYAGSPYNGVVIRMINTERRFLRAGSPGVIQGSQNLSHDHPVRDDGHYHPSNVSSSFQGRGDQTPAVAEFNPGVTGIGYANISVLSSGGDESRPYNMGVDYYMRIK